MLGPWGLECLLFFGGAEQSISDHGLELTVLVLVP